MSKTVNTLEYPLFRDYTLAIKTWLERTCYLNRLPHDKNVNIYPIQPERAFVKFVIPIINGSTLNPTITYNISPQIQYLENQNNLGFVRDRRVLKNTVKYKKPELVYELTYQVNILTKTKMQADVLLFQIMDAANKNQKAALRVQNQWAEIEAMNPRDETDLMPGEAQDLMFRHAIDLRIPRAMIPRSYKEFEIGEGVVVDIDSNSSIEVKDYRDSIYDLSMRDKL